MDAAEDGVKARIRQSYDFVAERYAQAIATVGAKPFEREQLDSFLQGLPEGSILDLGCGPGDVTRYLRLRRAGVVGIDLSPGMIRQARLADPGGCYEVGDMSALAMAGVVAGITAFYSLIHVSPAKVASTLACWRRALVPSGRILIAVHAGDATVHLDTFLEQSVDLDFHFFQPGTLEHQFRQASLDVVRLREREPYPDIEAQTRRLYVLARKLDD